jgi:hypothetical protein
MPSAMELPMRMEDNGQFKAGVVDYTQLPGYQECNMINYVCPFAQVYCRWRDVWIMLVPGVQDPL